MNLRPYQQEADNCTIQSFRRGVTKGLIALPTGLGKTVLFSKLPSSLPLPPGKKMAVLVHRNELATQAMNKIQRCNPDLKVAIEKAEHYAPLDSDVVIFSVQTISRGNALKDGVYSFNERLSRFNPDDFLIVVADEAHHATAESWRSCLAFFRVLKGTQYDDPTKLFLAVTATPRRADNIGMETICDEIYYSKDLASSIREGWLTDIKAFRVDTTIDISAVGTSHGDFKENELARVVDTPERNRKIVEKYIELGEGQRAVAFCVHKAHVANLAAAFQDAGIPVMSITDDTPKAERPKLLRLFSEGHFRVAVSCGVLSEGWDDPGVTVALMARPTKSGTLYTQCVGRVLRPWPAPEELAEYFYRGEEPPWIKPYAIVIDFCDLSSRHSLIDIPTLFGMKPGANLKGKKVNEEVEQIQKAIEQQKLPVRLDEIDSLDTLRAIAVRVNLLTPPRVPEEIRRISRFSWIETAANGWSMALPDRTVVRVQMDTLGHYEVSKSLNGIKTVVGKENTLEAAIERADQMVPQDAAVLLTGAAAWRKKPISDPQIRALWFKMKWNAKYKKNLPPTIQDFYAMARKQYPTMGHASDKLNELVGEETWAPKWRKELDAKRHAAHVRS